MSAIIIDFLCEVEDTHFGKAGATCGPSTALCWLEGLDASTLYYTKPAMTQDFQGLNSRWKEKLSPQPQDEVKAIVSCVVPTVT